MTVVEFSDFLCPYGREAATDLSELRRRHSDDIRFVYRHYPIHKGSGDAALAAGCARVHGACEQMHDALFERGAPMGSYALNALATTAGVVDSVAFSQCMTGRRLDSLVTSDSLAAVKLGLVGSPTLLVNGRISRGSRSIQDLADIVKQARKDPQP